MSVITTMEFPRLRQSLLSQFDNCALQAAMSLLYEDGWSSHPQARGTIFHRVAAKCLMEMYEQEENQIPVDVATAILREVLRQADVPPRDVVNIPLAEVKDLAWVVRKWAKDLTWDIASLVDVEQRLTAAIRYPDPSGGFVEREVTGALDALFVDATGQLASVVDFKDTWGLPGPTDLSFDGYFQQRMYAYLVMRCYPNVQQVTLRELYVRFSEFREATVFRSDMEEIEAELAALCERLDRALTYGVVPWDKQAKDIAKDMRAARRAAEAAAGRNENDEARKEMARWRALRQQYQVTVGLWQPSPGAHCSFCPRPTACPIQPQARGAGRIVDAAAAERVAAETVAADAAAKKGKDALKVWVDKNGPVNVKDAKGVRQYAHVPQDKTRRVTKEMIQEEVEKAARERRAPDIDGLYKKYVGTRFGLHKPKPTVDGVADPAEDTLIEQLEESVRQATARREAEAAS